jgi:hypothetical protein
MRSNDFGYRLLAIGYWLSAIRVSRFALCALRFARGVSFAAICLIY